MLAREEMALNLKLFGENVTTVHSFLENPEGHQAFWYIVSTLTKEQTQ